jgi:hypothetical protein
MCVCVCVCVYVCVCVCVYIYIYIYIERERERESECLTKWLPNFASVLHTLFEVIKTVTQKLGPRPLKQSSASVFWHASTTVLGLFSQTVVSDRRDFLSCAETSVKCISHWRTREMLTCFGTGLMSAMDREGSLQRNSGNALRMLQFQIETYFTTHTEFCDSVTGFCWQANVEREVQRFDREGDALGSIQGRSTRQVAISQDDLFICWTVPNWRL